MSTDAQAYQPLQDLTTYNTSYLEADALAVYQDYAAINANTQYGFTAGIDARATCANFLYRCYHAQENQDYSATATSGSSEALLLAAARLKNRAQAGQPKLICLQHLHSAWKGVAKLLSIELRILPNTVNSDTFIQALCPNTIGVIATLGCPTTLRFDPVATLNDWLASYYKQQQHFIPIHVDAAIGGFIAPFHFPALKWDFQLAHVQSINVSSHKYGLVYPALGWLVQNQSFFQQQALHQNDYLGVELATHSVRFSHSAGPLMCQMHQVKKLGFLGYEKVIAQFYRLAEYLTTQLARCPDIQVLPHQSYQLPGVVFTMQDQALNTLAEYLKTQGWYLPVYHVDGKPHARIVIRNGFTQAHLDRLVALFHTFSMKTKTQIAL